MEMNMPRNVARFIALRRAAEEYPLSRRKFQQLIQSGRLRAFRLDGKLILKREDIESLLTAKQVGADLDQIVSEVVGELGESGR
jgi:hypothetical protein